MSAGVVTINAGTVVGPGGVPGVPATPGGGGGIIGTAAKAIIPVAIASIAIGAAGALADAIDPSARAPGTTPLGQRDPRRFDKNGQVIQNSIKELSQKVGDTSTTQGEKTRAAFNMQSEKQKAAIAAAANKSTTDAERIKGSVITSEASAASRIVGAINAIPVPIINITASTVTKTTTVQDRSGPTGGSRDTARDGARER
jgi:hypothetical protein